MNKVIFRETKESTNCICLHHFQGLQCQERSLFLFSDMLLIAKERSSNFKLKDQVCQSNILTTEWTSIQLIEYFACQVPLSDLWLSTCISDVSEVTLDSARTFVIGWPITNAAITFRFRFSFSLIDWQPCLTVTWTFLEWFWVLFWFNYFVFSIIKIGGFFVRVICPTINPDWGTRQVRWFLNQIQGSKICPDWGLNPGLPILSQLSATKTPLYSFYRVCCFSLVGMSENPVMNLPNQEKNQYYTVY